MTAPRKPKCETCDDTGYYRLIGLEKTQRCEECAYAEDRAKTIREAREARKEEKRVLKITAATRMPTVKEQESTVHSEDDRTLFTFLLGHPTICARLYDRLIPNASLSVLTPRGSALEAIVLCGTLFSKETKR